MSLFLDICLGAIGVGAVGMILTVIRLETYL